jgi:hypothetical protein
MGLNIYLEKIQPTIVAERGITHNVVPMAKLCNVYYAVWRGDENGIEKAEDLIPLIENGIDIATEKYAELVKLNPSNGWGDADSFIAFLEHLLTDCHANPDATLTFSR